MEKKEMAYRLNTLPNWEVVSVQGCVLVDDGNRFWRNIITDPGLKQYARKLRKQFPEYTFLQCIQALVWEYALDYPEY